MTTEQQNLPVENYILTRCCQQKGQKKGNEHMSYFKHCYYEPRIF